MLICTKCKENKTEEEFTRSSYSSTGYQSNCRKCVVFWQKQFYKTKEGHISKAYTGAKQRAKQKKLAFNLTIAYLQEIATDVCPILDIPLKWGMGSGRSEDSPALDRIYPEKGYIIGNVCFISDRANRLKNDGKLSEFKKLITWLEKNA